MNLTFFLSPPVGVPLGSFRFVGNGGISKCLPDCESSGIPGVATVDQAPDVPESFRRGVRNSREAESRVGRSGRGL